MHQRIFAHKPTHEQPRVCALASALLRTNTPTAAHFRPLTHARAASHLRTFAPFSTKDAEQLSHTNKSFLQCNQIVAPMLSEGMYGGIWEKSIEFFQKVYRVSEKVYRVFSDRTIQTIRYLPSVAPFFSYKRTVISPSYAR